MDQAEMIRIGIEVSIVWIVALVTVELARRERMRSEAAVAELRALLSAKLEALQQGVEEISVPSNATEVFVPSTPENWESVREQWTVCRRALDEEVQAIRDAKVRLQMMKLPRYSYEAVIETLRSQGRFDLPTSDVLKLMDRRFTLLRRTRTATAEQAEQFSRWFDQITPALRTV